METDKATAIREARQQLRAEGKLDSMNAVVSLLHCSKRTARRYWQASAPEIDTAPPTPVPAPVPAPPAPEPPFSLANLRQYYRARHLSCWPNGILPPLTAYPLLKQLWQECDAAQAAAEREQRTLGNMLGQLPSTVDDTPLRAVEARRSAAGTMAHAIRSDMNLLEMRAHDEGRTL